MDHDQRFKVLLREFFAEFLQLFFPDWTARFDLTGLTWLEQELFTDPPQGERRYVDLVARLPVRQGLSLPGEQADTWITLVHVEIEHRETVQPLRRRMFEYYEHLRRRHGLPVLPIGLYLRVGMEGIGWDGYEEHFWEHRLVRFDYPYVGLPALDAEQYLRQDNWLGVALTALMRIPAERRVEFGEEAIKRVVQCPENTYRRFLLWDCLDAYLPLEEQERRGLEDKLVNDPNPAVRGTIMTFGETWREKGLREGREKGRQEGRQEGQREFLQLLLETRFGTLPAELRDRLAAIPGERLKDLLLAASKAHSLREVGLEGETTTPAPQA